MTTAPPHVSGSRPTSGSDELSVDELDAAIRHVAGRLNATTYQLLVLVREFDDRFGWAKWSFHNGSEWLAWRSGISVSAAREQLRTAHALRRLPLISEAFEQGRLSYAKVRALTRVADPHNEEVLRTYALDATVAQVEERCRQMRNVLPGSAHEARTVWERRSLTVWRNPARGTMSMTAELPAEVGELLLKALDRAIEAGDAASGPEFVQVSWQTQQADALVALAQAYLAGGSGADGRDRASAADHYQVVVHVDAAALGAAASSAGAPRPETSAVDAPVTSADADEDTVSLDDKTILDTHTALHGGAPRSDLPIEVIRRLTCDGSLVVVAEDGAGRPLNVGRKQRTVPTAIRRALWSRDRGCIFPGCGKTRWVHAHHLIHWLNGGETSVSNTILLCSHHHRLVHEGGYRIRRETDGGLYFERQDGRVIPRCGYRVDDAEPDPVHLGARTAEAWLTALMKRRKPRGEVRETSPGYLVLSER